MKKIYLWPILYAIVLLIFTGYVILDTFVIPRAYIVLDTEAVLIESQINDVTSNISPNLNTITEGDIIEGVTAEVSSTDTSYSDENISITLSEYREYSTSIYVADIYVSSINYLATAFADNTYGKNIKEKTSVIAEEHDAILAINGDFYGAQNDGYVIRNGQIYRDTSSDATQEDLVIYTDGSFGIVTEGSTTASELLENGALQVLSFGPGLVDEGEIIVTTSAMVDKEMESNPRTAIGIIDDLHYIIVVSDGRTNESAGLTLYELATFMDDLGASEAYNLDGGGSSTMYFNGSIVNNPTTNGKKFSERSVSDIVYIRSSI